MFQIRTATDTDFSSVLALLSGLQVAPEHHIGFHGNNVAEIADELTDLAWPAATVLAVDGVDQVRGVLSVEVDPRLGCVAWFGPFVDVPAQHPAADRIWQRTADALYAAGRALPMMCGVPDGELSGHVEHGRLATFARRQGFYPGDRTTQMIVAGVDLVRLVGAVPGDHGNVQVTDVTGDRPRPALACPLARLHDQHYPSARISGAQLGGGVPDRTLILATEGDRLLGYAAGRAHSGDYLVDFAVVCRTVRDARLGATLVTTLVQSLAERHGPRRRAIVTVTGHRTDSLDMFTRLGFAPVVELVGYRRRAASQVA